MRFSRYFSPTACRRGLARLGGSDHSCQSATLPNPLASLLQYLRDRERSGALVLALVVEALLVLAVLSIGLYDPPKPPRAAALVSLNVAAPSRPKADQPKPAAAAPKSALHIPTIASLRFTLELRQVIPNCPVSLTK